MSGRFGQMAMDSELLATDPPVSEKQRRAMFAAKNGKSTLGIPKKVGEEFVGKDAESESASSLYTIIKGKKFKVRKTGGKYFYFSPLAIRWLPISKSRVEGEDKTTGDHRTGGRK